jgi:hypothetical protein
MEFPSESVSGLTPSDKIVTAAEAVALVRDSDTIVVEGFAGQCFAEELTLALEARFLQTGSPRELTLAFTVAQGNRQERGSDRLRYEGLLKRAIGGHWGMSGELGKMAVDNSDRHRRLISGCFIVDFDHAVAPQQWAYFSFGVRRRCGLSGSRSGTESDSQCGPTQNRNAAPRRPARPTQTDTVGPTSDTHRTGRTHPRSQ